VASALGWAGNRSAASPFFPAKVISFFHLSAQAGHVACEKVAVCQLYPFPIPKPTPPRANRLLQKFRERRGIITSTK